jgi:DNA-binding LacI/PurR family transcriptional regulator
MVAGFDDIPESRRLPYQLTTVRQPLEEMVAETVALLHLDQEPQSIETGLDRAIKGQLIWRNTVPMPKLEEAGSEERATPPQLSPPDHS